VWRIVLRQQQNNLKTVWGRWVWSTLGACKVTF
jgi:hypothetical protein